MSAARRRVLFVSYLFPPTGGVGVHRATKFVKYLPEFGWDCSVLTVENPSAPLTDASLLQDVPAATIVHRARTLEPGYALKSAVSASSGKQSSRWRSWAKRLARGVSNLALQPDPQILWRPAALKLGRKILSASRHDAVIATGPPFSSLLLGASLARSAKLPLVLDYRDEWGISNAYWENKRPGRLAHRIQHLMQRSAVRAADVLLATSPATAEQLGRIAAEAHSAAETTFIYNGFDPCDFARFDSAPVPRADYGNGTQKYRLAFVGTLWALNPIGPVVEALLRLHASAPQLLAELELVVAGRRTADQEAALDRLNGLPCAVVRLPFVTHDEACRLMWTADGLLLLNADLPDTHRIINAKTFEYMAARKPIFVVAPEGNLWNVVRDLPGTVLTTPGKTAQIADGLALVLEQHRCGVDFSEAPRDVTRFERRSLAGELGRLLDELVERRGAAECNRPDRVQSNLRN